MQVVQVQWVDSASEDGWQSKSHVKHASKLCYCESVGFLLRKNKGDITLVQSTGSFDNVAASISIPMSCVKKITKLKEK